MLLRDKSELPGLFSPPHLLLLWEATPTVGLLAENNFHASSHFYQGAGEENQIGNSEKCSQL